MGAGGVTVVLCPGHRRFLAERAVPEAVAAERGYRSVTDPGELLEVGFPRRQARYDTPGLLIPRYGLDGRATWPKVRPDRPRFRRDGTPVKYDSPAGSWSVLDCLPGRLEALDRAPEVWVSCEGFVKADAMTGAGVVAVAIDGVWGWRSAGEPLAAWAVLARRPRWWHLVADNDLVSSWDVPAAVARLGAHLKALGGRVRILHPPAGPAKVGVDDHLAGGGDLDGLTQVGVDTVAEVLSRRRGDRPRGYPAELETAQ